MSGIDYFALFASLGPCLAVSCVPDAALVHLLLEQRAEVEVTGREGETPVHLASLMGHAKVLDLLLEASASPNILAIDGKGALSHACYRGHLEVVQSLLLYKAVDRPDAGQRRGLHWAAQHGHEAILDILLPSSINAQDAVGATALSLAAQRGHLEVVRQLVEANAELDLQGCDGETALMLASLNGHLEVVQYLVQANADLMITAKDGFDALRLAAEAEQLEVMQQLLLLGAEVPPEGLLLPQDASCSEDLVLTKSLAKQLLVERAVAGDDALARQWGFNGNGQQLLDAVSRAGCEVPQAKSALSGKNPRTLTDFTSSASVGTEVKSQKEQGENPWTLVWISDQAFKPTAVSLKTQLESLGCQVKGYKTNKNAARALDKKRGLVRTVVMVTAAEALPFLQYLSSRPELASTPVVVEATRGYGSIPKSPSVQVCESFDAAAKAVWTVAHEPGFG
ncbi:unnamed protein product [Durusdinium trenchii]|uniref:Uncharacterized protein n=1 Tax=Durusdinium trenchii TaxID=1381693 RepID=A0ABP0LSD7_9DINO